MKQYLGYVLIAISFVGIVFSTWMSFSYVVNRGLLSEKTVATYYEKEKIQKKNFYVYRPIYKFNVDHHTYDAIISDFDTYDNLVKFPERIEVSYCKMFPTLCNITVEYTTGTVAIIVFMYMLSIIVNVIGSILSETIVMDDIT